MTVKVHCRYSMTVLEHCPRKAALKHRSPNASRARMRAATSRSPASAGECGGSPPLSDDLIGATSCQNGATASGVPSPGVSAHPTALHTAAVAILLWLDARSIARHMVGSAPDSALDLVDVKPWCRVRSDLTGQTQLDGARAAIEARFGMHTGPRESGFSVTDFFLQVSRASPLC